MHKAMRLLTKNVKLLINESLFMHLVSYFPGWRQSQKHLYYWLSGLLTSINKKTGTSSLGLSRFLSDHRAVWPLFLPSRLTHKVRGSRLCLRINTTLRLSPQRRDSNPYPPIVAQLGFEPRTERLMRPTLQAIATPAQE